MPAHYAHSENATGRRHSLVDHLRAVAALARTFADKFGAGELAYWAGLWHDLGKFHPDFQRYILAPDPSRRVDHSSAGAVHSCGILEPLAFPIGGHHGGLPSASGLRARLSEKRTDPRVTEALRIARSELHALEPAARLDVALPAFLLRPGLVKGEAQRETEFFIRMLFSALADADFLDTEAHFKPERSDVRRSVTDLRPLLAALERDHAELGKNKSGVLNEARKEVYLACLEAADSPQGAFRLTVPTGGGKTLSSMAFALKHALKHGLDRVIVAIPYTSIIEQTADVYRQVFKDVVLEHHSGVDHVADPDDPISAAEVWHRLAAENWDAPIVVTTTVQLLESLLSNRPSSCRKLHNVARSVIIIDEVQTLPTHILRPALDVLRSLTEHYGASLLLSTATQPTLQDSPYFQGFASVTEIVPKPERHFAVLRRVEYEFAQDVGGWSWQRVADEMRTAPRCLAVVNTKRDAWALLDALADQDALHLSTQMCGAHRRETLTEVRRRLCEDLPCCLVSTQVVEAGVDLDFPLVLRAIGPLDRIVQAAGRCNREGKLLAGRVVIFRPAGGGLPSGAYRTGADTAATLLAEGRDLHDPATYETYFERLFQVENLDRPGVQSLRESFDYPEVAARFRLIEDDTLPVVVRYERCRRHVSDLLERLTRDPVAGRQLLRALQPYVVSVRRQVLQKYLREGLAMEVVPGLWEWLSGYDAVRGLEESARDPEELVV